MGDEYKIIMSQCSVCMVAAEKRQAHNPLRLEQLEEYSSKS